MVGIQSIPLIQNGWDNKNKAETPYFHRGNSIEYCKLIMVQKNRSK